MTKTVEGIASTPNAIDGLLQGLNPKKKPSGMQTGYLRINEVAPRYCSRRSIYYYSKAGLFKIYKLGSKSFVKADEFFAAFKPAGSVNKSKGGDASC